MIKFSRHAELFFTAGDESANEKLCRNFSSNNITGDLKADQRWNNSIKDFSIKKVKTASFYCRYCCIRWQQWKSCKRNQFIKIFRRQYKHTRNILKSAATREWLMNYNFVHRSKWGWNVSPEKNFESSPSLVGLKSLRTREVWHNGLEEEQPAQIKKKSLLGYLLCSALLPEKFLELDIFSYSRNLECHRNRHLA